MAYYYNLAAFVGPREDAEAFVAHFHGRVVPIPGAELAITIAMRETRSGWVVGLWPEGMSHGTGDDPRLVEPEAREAAARWFERELRTAPSFRAAVFGAEVYDDFIETSLEEIVRSGGMGGLVIDARVHASLGAPEGTKPFAPGKRWWPRSGAP